MENIPAMDINYLGGNKFCIKHYLANFYVVF